MGVLFKNENLIEDMIDILRYFQGYLLYIIVDGEKKFIIQLCIGDQLLVECVVNVIYLVVNGYIVEDCFEGFNM